MTDIGDLLRRSIATHMRAADLRKRKDPKATETLREARDLRLEAFAADPFMKDPAWAAETVTHPKTTKLPGSHPAQRTTFPVSHDALMAFYAERLG